MHLLTPSPASPLTAAFDPQVDGAVALQRQRTLRAGSRLRLLGAGLFLLLTLALALGGDASWWPYVAPLAVYAAGAAALVVLQRTRLAERWLGSAQSTLDVAVVWGLQHAALPTSPFPQGAAGFALGLFALVVVLAGMGLRPAVTALTAVLAAAAQGALMREAGVDWGAVAAAALVLGLVAAVSHFASGRVRSLAAGLASAEVGRQLEARRFEEVEAQRAVIARMLEEAQDANARLVALQRDREGLVQLMVHDLRAPLTAVAANLELLEYKLDRLEGAPPLLSRSARDASVAARRLAAMISDILQVAKLEEGRLEVQRQPLAARGLLASVCAQARAVADARGVQVELAAPEGLSLTGDGGLLTRVLENLASNAVRFTPRGGRVLLEAREEGGAPLLAVRNQGEPIPPALRERIFEKFDQGAAEGGRAGWGLGLYFCRLAVAAHGGAVAVEEAPGWATSFVVRLPR
jgi:signal transduction histidine kinase